MKLLETCLCWIEIEPQPFASVSLVRETSVTQRPFFLAHLWIALSPFLNAQLLVSIAKSSLLLLIAALINFAVAF